jgi:hypothetical protein
MDPVLRVWLPALLLDAHSRVPIPWPDPATISL